MRRVAFLLTTVVYAQGQAPPEPVKLGNVLVQGWIRSRLENWDAFSGTEAGRYTYSGNFVRLTFSQSFKRYDWSVEIAAPVLLNLPEDGVLPAPQGALGQGPTYYQNNHNRRNTGMVFPKQAFIRIKGLFGDDKQNVRFGRFEFVDGSEATPKNATLAAVKRDRINQRIVGPFGFTHVMRSFDGLHYSAAHGNMNFAFVGALPTRGVFQVDGWGPLRVGFGYLSATGQLPGKKQYGEWRLLGMYYHDWRNLAQIDNRTAAARALDRRNLRIGTMGGHYLHAWDTPSGTVNFMTWAMSQFGRWGRLDHRAGAIAIEGGWQPKILPKLKPWFQAGGYRGSGDGDSTNTTHSTFFQMLPTARPYARFPFFNLMNNEDDFVSMILRPHKAITTRTDIRSIRLNKSQDLWYQGGGAFQPWSFGFPGRPSGGARSVATLFDTSVDVTVNRYVGLTVYYGYAIGKSVITNIYSRGKNGHLGFLEMNYRF